MRKLLFALALALPVVVVGAALAPLDVAQASVSIPEPFDALVRDSTAVALATPTTETCVWEGGRIITYTQVHIDTLVAGDAGPQDQEVWVRTLGGAVGHIGQNVDGEPSFTVGHPSLLFLRAFTGPDKAKVAGMFTITARGQGQFPVVADEQQELRVRRSATAGAMMLPPNATPALLAVDVLHGRKVAEATQAVVTAWSRLHAP